MPTIIGRADQAVAAEIPGPIARILGIAPQITAVLLIIFTLVVSLISHASSTFPAETQSAHQTQFVKNVAIVGGLLFYFASGAGVIILSPRLLRRAGAPRDLEPRATQCRRWRSDDRGPAPTCGTTLQPGPRLCQWSGAWHVMGS